MDNTDTKSLVFFIYFQVEFKNPNKALASWAKGCGKI